MKVDEKMTDDQVLGVIGERLAAQRLAMNLTQGDLAQQAGLGLRTVQRLELGKAATQLSGFVRVCRVLGLLPRLDALLPEPTASPMAQLKSQKHQRQRASGSKAAGKAAKPWTWGDAS